MGKRVLLLSLFALAACSPARDPKDGASMKMSATQPLLIPPIDADPPKKLETARFALG